MSNLNRTTEIFARIAEVQALTRTAASPLPKPTLYDHIKKGLLPPPIKLSIRSAVWIIAEIEAVNRARIAGKSNEQIRELVTALVAARSESIPTSTDEVAA
jgi:prophage regulatory protein